MASEPTSSELVIRRAFELAEATSAQSEGLTHRQLGEVAAEVGLPLGPLAESLAESVVRVETKRSIVDRLVGRSEVSAHRAAPLRAAVIDQSLVDWFESGHGMVTRRSPDGVVVAERRRGLGGSLSRGVAAVKGTGSLTRARTVRGASVEVADDQGAVCVVADVSGQRQRALIGGSAVAAGGGSFALVIGIIAWPVAAVGVPLAIGAGVATGRIAYSATVAPIRRDLERTVDQITTGERPPTVVETLTRAMRRRAHQAERSARHPADGGAAATTR